MSLWTWIGDALFGGDLEPPTMPKYIKRSKAASKKPAAKKATKKKRCATKNIP